MLQYIIYVWDHTHSLTVNAAWEGRGGGGRLKAGQWPVLSVTLRSLIYTFLPSGPQTRVVLCQR